MVPASETVGRNSDFKPYPKNDFKIIMLNEYWKNKIIKFLQNVLCKKLCKKVSL